MTESVEGGSGARGLSLPALAAGRRLLGRVKLFMAPLYARLGVVLGLFLLPVVVYAIVSSYHAYLAGQSQVQDTVRQVGELEANQEETVIASAKKLLVTLVKTDALPAPLLQLTYCSENAASVLDVYKEYSYLAITDSAGHVVCSSVASGIGIDLSDQYWWRQARDGRRTIVSDLVESKLTAGPIVTVAAPLGEPDAPFRGVIFIGINVHSFAGLAKESGLPSQTVAYILDRSGHVVSRDEGLVSIAGVSQNDLAGHPSLGGLPPPELLKSMVAGEFPYFISAGIDGVSRIYYASPLQGTRLLILVGLPQSLLLGGARGDMMRAMIIPLAMMIWALMVAAFAGHFMVARGLRSLSRTARALRRGNYAARPQLTHGPLELVQLSDTLSELAKRVEQHEQSLSRTIEQKDAMLREIHHRIKNNLQVVTSLMSLQAGRLRDPAAKAALADLQRRVRSLSLLHRHLYEGDDLRYLDFGQFVTELCLMVKESSGPAVQDVAIEVDIPPVPVSPDRAVPIALLITEALSNALRHAYPKGGRGRVRVELTAGADAMATVSIVDDGVGWVGPLADGAAANSSAVGIGLSLMQVFARQLGSELKVEGPPGTTIQFSFALA